MNQGWILYVGLDFELFIFTATRNFGQIGLLLSWWQNKPFLKNVVC